MFAEQNYQRMISSVSQMYVGTYICDEAMNKHESLANSRDIT